MTRTGLHFPFGYLLHSQSCNISVVIRSGKGSGVPGGYSVSGNILADGMRLHYSSQGSGAPLILLHGLVGSSQNWQRNTTYLAREASVYALDLFNMGNSERVTGLDASLAATADRTVRCMDALGLEQADIAGHSHGGALAMMLAARHPSRVRTLILCAPANPFCQLGSNLINFYTSSIGQRFARLIPRMPSLLKAIALRRMYGDPHRVPPGALQGYTDGLRSPATIQHVLAILRLWGSDMLALKAALPEIASKPVLLLWGDRDRAVGLSSGQQLHQNLPASQIVVVPGAGHIAFEEMPERCNPVIRDWLRAASASRPELPATSQTRTPAHQASSAGLELTPWQIARSG